MVEDVESQFFTGFSLSANNRIIMATISTSLICYNAQTGSIVRCLQSGLPPNVILKSFSNSFGKKHSTIVSLLHLDEPQKSPSPPPLLVWNLSWLDDHLHEFMPTDSKLFSQPLDICLLPKLDHDSPSNSSLAIACSTKSSLVKLLDLKNKLSVASTIDILSLSTNSICEQESSSFKLVQAGLDASGRFGFFEYNIDEFDKKLIPGEDVFLKKKCLIIDLTSTTHQIIIDSFVYIIRKSPSSFRIRHKFIVNQNQTYLVIKVSCCLKDFDCTCSCGGVDGLDWCEFETSLKIYGPLEQQALLFSGSGVQRQVDEIKLSGESIENELCITETTNIFASIMHKNFQQPESKEPPHNWTAPKQFLTHLNIVKIFDDKSRTTGQLYSINELLTDDEQSSSNVFLDLRLVSTSNVALLIYSKDGGASSNPNPNSNSNSNSRSSNSFRFNYDELKFERNFIARKGALVYDLVTNQILRRISNVLRDDTNVDRILFASNYLVLDPMCWILYDLKNDDNDDDEYVGGGRQINELKHLRLNRKCTEFILDGVYLVSCSDELDELVVIRTKDLHKLASVKLTSSSTDRIESIRVGEASRTILVGTVAGCLMGFKLVIDLENEVYLERFVKFYRDSNKLMVRESAIGRPNSRENNEFKNGSMRRTSSRNGSGSRFMRRALSTSCSSRLSDTSTVPSDFLHLGIAQTNLMTITDGIKNSHRQQTRACLIQ